MKETSSYFGYYAVTYEACVGMEESKEVEREGEKTDERISVHANRPKIHELCGSHNNNKYLTFCTFLLNSPRHFFS